LTTHNFGHRYTANGNYEQQLTGIIGQSVVMEIFGLGFIDGSSGFDHGVDIYFEGLKIDVKTMGRTTDVTQITSKDFRIILTLIFIFFAAFTNLNEL